METKDWLKVPEWGLLTLIFTLGPRCYGWIICWLFSSPPSDPMLLFLSIPPWTGQKFPQEESCNPLPGEWGLANCQILAAEWGEGGSFCIDVFLSTFTRWFVDSWEQICDQVSSAQETEAKTRLSVLSFILCFQLLPFSFDSLSLVLFINSNIAVYLFTCLRSLTCSLYISSLRNPFLFLLVLLPPMTHSFSPYLGHDLSYIYLCHICKTSRSLIQWSCMYFWSKRMK